MTDEQFFAAVAEMRRYQRAFFAALPDSDERRTALTESKRRERAIDAEIRRRTEPPPPDPKQTSMFGGAK